MKTNESTLSQVMDRLNNRGYKEQFKIVEDKIEAISSGEQFTSDQMKIIKEYRFDGMTNPDDESTLYSMETDSGVKGTLVVSGGVHSEENTSLLSNIRVEKQND